eukprot:1004116_1
MTALSSSSFNPIIFNEKSFKLIKSLPLTPLLINCALNFKNDSDLFNNPLSIFSNQVTTSPEFHCSWSPCACGILICGDLYFANTELSKLGYVVSSDPKQSLPRWFGFNSGLMLYSKIPSQASGAFPYNATHLPFPKSLVCRGLIYGIYQINTHDQLLVVNTHFENAVRPAKLSEIEDLAHCLNTKLNCNGIKYVIVMGDFNICSNDSWELNIDKEKRLYRTLSDTLRDVCGLQYDLFRDCQRSFRYELTERPNAVYDHMFVNENLHKTTVQQEVKDWVENGLAMSDHFGLM